MPRRPSTTILATDAHPIISPASRMYTVGMPIASFGFYLALLPPVLVATALKVSDVAPQNQASVLGLTLGIGAVAATVANPLVGRLSDRTASRFGMRRPWIIGGALLGFLGLVVIALTSSVPVLVVAWAVTQISYNAVLSALTAILPDHVERSKRGRVAAALGLSQNVAYVVGTFLVQLFTTSVLQLLVPGALGTALILLYAFTFKDRHRDGKAIEPLDVKEVLGAFVFNPRKHPDLGWAWLTRFLMVAAQFTALSYLTYFLLDLGVPKEAVATDVFLATLFNVMGIVATSLVAGWLSDRFNRRKIFVIISGLVSVVGLSVIAVSPNLTSVLVGELVMGAGMGVYYAVDLALVTDVLPSSADNGKDLGVVNIANALPQSLVPSVAPAIVAATGGYGGFFLTGAFVGLLGILSVTRVRSVR